MMNFSKTVPAVLLIAALASGCQTTGAQKFTPQELVAKTSYDYQVCRVALTKGGKLPAGLKNCDAHLAAFEQASVAGGIAPAKARKLAADLKKNTTLALRKNGLR